MDIKQTRAILNSIGRDVRREWRKRIRLSIALVQKYTFIRPALIPVIPELTQWCELRFVRTVNALVYALCA